MAHVQKRKVGRPTKLTPELVDLIKKYIAEYEPWYETPVETQDKKGNVTTKMVRMPNPPPSIIDLDRYLKQKGKPVHRVQLYRWNMSDNMSAEAVEFRIIFKMIKPVIEEGVCENALTGAYNAFFSKFYLTNNSTMRDEKHVDHTTKGDKLPTPTCDLSKLSTEELETLEKITAKAEDGTIEPPDEPTY